MNDRAQPPDRDKDTRTYDRGTSVVFRRAADEFGGLSNMTGRFAICVEDVRTWSSEALYQACRYPHLPNLQAEILAERSPMTAKMRSKPFRQDSRPDWSRVRVRVMRWCLRIKLANNWDAFGQLLRLTGTRPIVEESLKDDFWGARPAGPGELVGQNVLGRLLMELREQLLDRPESLQVVEPPKVDEFRLLGHEVGTVFASSRNSHTC
jgi:type I restriction enzyme S subunit